MKSCSRCKKNKNYSDFNRHPSSKDGHGSWCKQCQKDDYTSKKIYKFPPKEKDGKIYCTQCSMYLDPLSFPKIKKSWCKQCQKEYDQNKIDLKRVMPRKMQGNKIHCRHCEQYLDRSNFWGNDLSYCRPCKKIVGINSNLRKKGLDMESYSILEKSQNGVCAICKNSEKHNKRLSVDHDHNCCPGTKTCGKCTRGLLCSICNKTLGMVNDDIKILQDMIDYLQK
jgi:hypothetical protein